MSYCPALECEVRSLLGESGPCQKLTPAAPGQQAVWAHTQMAHSLGWLPAAVLHSFRHQSQRYPVLLQILGRQSVGHFWP